MKAVLVWSLEFNMRDDIDSKRGEREPERESERERAERASLG